MKVDNDAALVNETKQKPNVTAQLLLLRSQIEKNKSEIISEPQWDKSVVAMLEMREPRLSLAWWILAPLLLLLPLPLPLQLPLPLSPNCS